MLVPCIIPKDTVTPTGPSLHILRELGGQSFLTVSVKPGKRWVLQRDEIPSTLWSLNGRKLRREGGWTGGSWGEERVIY